MTRANNAPWFTKAGAASSIMPISHLVDSNIFALKGGGYGCLFSLDGIDPESRTDALRLLLATSTASELRVATPTVHRLFVDARAPIIEES
jgi:hypothetical protein